MTRANQPHDPDEALRLEVHSKKTWLDHVALGGCLLLLLGPIIAGCFFYYVAQTAFSAEKNLHTAVFVIHLVDEFVKKHNRWPTSWDELESCKPPECNNTEQVAVFFGPWPGSIKEIRNRINVDFHPDLKEIVRQDSSLFTAIMPKGGSYEYRDYGDVIRLKETMLRLIPGLK